MNKKCSSVPLGIANRYTVHAGAKALLFSAALRQCFFSSCGKRSTDANTFDSSDEPLSEGPARNALRATVLPHPWSVGAPHVLEENGLLMRTVSVYNRRPVYRPRNVSWWVVLPYVRAAPYVLHAGLTANLGWLTRQKVLARTVWRAHA